MDHALELGEVYEGDGFEDVGDGLRIPSPTRTAGGFAWRRGNLVSALVCYLAYLLW
jgi:hypothetical protein